jgi:hypothetical protein
MDTNRKINGFNNGRDASSGVGGRKSSFELAQEIKLPRKIKIQDTIEVIGRGTILTLDLRENGFEDNFDKVLQENFSKDQIVQVGSVQYKIRGTETKRGMNGTMPHIGLLVTKIYRMITIQAPEGSFIATPSDNIDEIRLRFEEWLNGTKN